MSDTICPNNPVDGVCCNCGYDSEEWTLCLSKAHDMHCKHWWDGIDGGGTLSDLITDNDLAGERGYDGDL